MSAINLLDKAISISAGDPVEVELLGVKLSLRRDFTGEEVQDIISAHYDHEDETFEDQTTRIIALVSDSDGKARKAFVKKCMELRVVVLQKVIVEIGIICGFRGEDGLFLSQ